MEKEIILSVDQTIEEVTENVSKHILWHIVNATIFRLFPTRMKRPRILLLELFGAKLAKTCTISRTVEIDFPWNLEIGHLSGIGAHSYVNCYHKIRIGDKCRIGEHVNLLAGDIHSDRINNQIVIDNGCWISSGSSVLQGVRLGQYTMVGENSIVDVDTQPYTTVAGMPAKIIEKAILVSSR
jgi:putative colanic acid biosynthesis acetyltransferase WcaF